MKETHHSAALGVQPSVHVVFLFLFFQIQAFDQFLSFEGTSALWGSGGIHHLLFKLSAIIWGIQGLSLNRRSWP